MKAIREKAHAQFRGILTPEQQQLDQHLQRMQQRMEQFRRQQQPQAEK